MRKLHNINNRTYRKLRGVKKSSLYLAVTAILGAVSFNAAYAGAPSGNWHLYSDPITDAQDLTLEGKEAYGGISGATLIIEESGSIEVSTKRVAAGASSGGSSGNQLINWGSIIGANNVYGGLAQNGSADNNSVKSSGNIDANVVWGAYAETTGTSVSANGNTVEITGGTVSLGDVDGGYARSSQDATADNNVVKITGGSVYVGSYFRAGYANGNGSGTVSASSNKVILGTGTYHLEIYGGVASGGATRITSDNEIHIYGNADVSSTKIYGGSSDASTVTGNKLFFGYEGQAWAPANYTVNKIANFSSISLKAVTWGKTISVQYFANASTDTTVTKVDATKVAFSGTDTLTAGNSYKMLTIGTIESGSIDLTSAESTFTLGTAVEGTGTVSLADADGNGENDTVVYTVATANQLNPDPDPNPQPNPSDNSGMHATPQTHSAAMAYSVAAVALNQGADTGSAALSNLSGSGVDGVQGFSSVGGGTARVDTGSHVTLNALNLSVGVGRNITSDKGLLSIGGAFEAGYGRFKNHFDAGAADPFIKKSGHVSYYGVAALGNMMFENMWHVNAALRFGKISSSVDDGLYDAGAQRHYDMDTSAYYIGAELGLGRVIKIDESNRVDIYGKYYFGYQDSDSFNAGAEKYCLDSVTSHRLRAAGRYEHSFTPKTSLYAGLGLEHEFDGKSKLKIKTNAGTFTAEPAEIDGTRVFAEAGVRIIPEGNKGVNFDLGIKGLCGEKYRGAWATAEIKYTF